METALVKETVTDCMSGDEAAIAHFVQEHQMAVYRLAVSILDDPAEANEATQDALLAALKALKDYKEENSFKAWLYKITLNTCRSRLRKRRAFQRLKERLGNHLRIQVQKEMSLEENLIQQEKDAALWKALNSLSDKQRIPIVLRYYHDLSTAEIAEILGLNPGTVHSRLSIGRDRLRAALEKQSGRRGDAT